MTMSIDVYEQLKKLFPELKETKIPEETTDFDTFFEWLNTKNTNIHSLNFEEFYQNGIDENSLLNQAGVNVIALQDDIDQAIEKLNSQYSSADNLDDYEGDILDIEDRQHTAFFGSLQHAAEEHNLTTLVIDNDQPYWLVVPNQQEIVMAFIDAFNQNFQESGLEISEVE